MKGSVSEGGIRVPMIASWPNKIKSGSISNHISAFYDFFETACDVAGINNKVETDGISFYPEMIGGVQAKHDYLYWEYPASGGLQAIRMGRWKGVKNNLFKSPSKLKLFDLMSDEKELNDISLKHPKIVIKLEQKLIEAHSTPYLKEFIIPSLEQ